MNTNLNILVVDDEEKFLEAISDVLKSKGYKVDTAIDGYQLIDKVKKSHFDIILLDVRLPGIDGVHAFIKIKGIIPNTAVIMITAYADEDLVRDALKNGAYACLYKPLNIDKLLSIIEEAHAKKIVLLVDDRLSVHEILPDVLEDKGYKVATVEDAHQALEEVRKKHYGIILLDVKLPDMNGVELFKEIKKVDPEAAVIMMTAYSVDRPIKEALQKGVYACLRKPIDIDKLIDTIETIK